MVFPRIIYSAILVGIATGTILSALQVTSLNPIIFAAEDYELAQVETARVDNHSSHSADHDHGHDVDAWAPAGGFERTVYTFLANVLASTGFAAVLLALMSQFCLLRNRDISRAQGLLWGLAGYTALFLAPAIAMPPEIPGVTAAPVEQRQLWWTLTVLCVAIGLGLIAFAPSKIRILGLPLLALPYVLGAPHGHGPMFAHPEPAAVAALTSLHQQFVVTSAVVNLVFWLLLGLACRFAFNRWLRKILLLDDDARA